MSHILKLSEWEIAGKWYCADTTDLGAGSGNTWFPARMLNITPADYLLLLKDKFHVKNLKIVGEKCNLIFNFETMTDCHSFVLFINREAKERKYFIC